MKRRKVVTSEALAEVGTARYERRFP